MSDHDYLRAKMQLARSRFELLAFSAAHELRAQMHHIPSPVAVSELRKTLTENFALSVLRHSIHTSTPAGQELALRIMSETFANTIWQCYATTLYFPQADQSSIREKLQTIMPTFRFLAAMPDPESFTGECISPERLAAQSAENLCQVYAIVDDRIKLRPEIRKFYTHFLGTNVCPAMISGHLTPYLNCVFDLYAQSIHPFLQERDACHTLQEEAFLD